MATGVRSFQLKGMPVASGVVNRFDSVMIDLVRVARRALDVEEAFAAGAARLVDHDDRLLHQIVLGDDALDGPRHLIGAAAGAGRHDELQPAASAPRPRLQAACSRRAAPRRWRKAKQNDSLASLPIVGVGLLPACHPFSSPPICMRCRQASRDDGSRARVVKRTAPRDFGISDASKQRARVASQLLLFAAGGFVAATFG